MSWSLVLGLVTLYFIISVIVFACSTGTTGERLAEATVWPLLLLEFFLD